MKPDDETRALKSVLFDQAVETSRRGGRTDKSGSILQCNDWAW